MNSAVNVLHTVVPDEQIFDMLPVNVAHGLMYSDSTILAGEPGMMVVVLTCLCILIMVYI